MFERLFESRAVSYQTVFATGGEVDFGNLSNTSVNADNVFQVNAIFSAVSLIADTISTLPVDVFVRRDGARFPFRPAPAWVQKPDVDLPKEAFYNALIVSLLLDGNAFVRIFSNPQGEIVNMIVLNPLTVKIKRSGIGRLVFKVEGEDRPLSSEDILFIPDVVKPGEVRGVSRVEALKENFGLAIAMEKFAATFFGQGTNLSGVIEVPGNITQEQSEQLRNGFDRAHAGWRRGHRTGVLSGGATWKQTQIDPEKSTIIESRNQAVLDICRAFNVPPHLLAITEGTSSYASVEQTNLAWVTHGLRPIIQKIEGAMSPLMARTPGGENAFIKFNLDGLLRADISSRTAAYANGIQSGYLTINDVRRLEDLRPIDDPAAETVRVPLSNLNIDAADLSAQDKRVTMAAKLISVGFKPGDVLSAMGLDPIEHTGIAPAALQQVQIADPENIPEYEVD
jgi:HK97 family phage portal protein